MMKKHALKLYIFFVDVLFYSSLQKVKMSDQPDSETQLSLISSMQILKSLRELLNIYFAIPEKTNRFRNTADQDVSDFVIYF